MKNKLSLYAGIACIFAGGLIIGLSNAHASDAPPAAPKPPETVLKSEYEAVVVERDHLRQQLNEAMQTAAIYHTQRNELASNVLDLTAAVGALREENKRLSAPPAK